MSYTILYICIYVSVATGKHYSAAAESISDAMLVARDMCLKGSQSTNECELEGCRKK